MSCLQDVMKVTGAKTVPRDAQGATQTGQSVTPPAVNVPTTAISCIKINSVVGLDQ
jgi:hypothetical protein